MASRQGSFRARTGAFFICVHLRDLPIRPRYERVASVFVRSETDHPQMDADLRRWLRDKVRSERERVAAFIYVHLRHLRIRSLGTNASHQCSFAARPDHPQMDADLRRWLRDKVRSERERVPLLSAYICVICGFVLGTNGSHQSSFSAGWR